jgi:hypothetical protein
MSTKNPQKDVALRKVIDRVKKKLAFPKDAFMGGGPTQSRYKRELSSILKMGSNDASVKVQKTLLMSLISRIDRAMQKGRKTFNKRDKDIDAAVQPKSSPPSRGKKRLTVKSRSEATSSPPSRGKKRLQVKPKSAFDSTAMPPSKGKKRLQVKPRSAFKPEEIRTLEGSVKKNVPQGTSRTNPLESKPRSIAAAKKLKSKYFWDKKGVKKLAVTAEELKKLGMSLSEWANTFAKRVHTKKETGVLKPYAVKGN